jgi:hypothetical protein
VRGTGTGVERRGYRRDVAVATEDRPRHGPGRRQISLPHRRLAWIALAVLLVAAAAFLYDETRGATFWFDEWEWTIGRRGDDPDALLEPHNSHLSVVPILIYRALYTTFGLDVYGPYRLAVVLAHLGCVLLVFVYANRRVGGFVALLAAASLLFLGPAWENILWPFQVGWLVSLAAGLGALLLVDRRDRRGDVAASILLGLALASSGLGVPIALGLGVDVVWGRRRWRDAWVVGAPLAAYGVWWLIYQDTALLGRLVDVPGFVVDAASASVASLAGVAGDPVPRARGNLLSWGRPLAVVAMLVLVWRLVRLGRIPPRVLALLTVVLSFWIATELSRGAFSTAYESRYVYVGAMFAVLVAVELARGVSISWRVALVLGAAVTAAVVSNVGVLRDAGEFLRTQGQVTRAVLGAVEIGRPVVKPDHDLGLPGYPWVDVQASSYFAATREDGTPAATPAELGTQPWYARREADRELIRIHDIDLAPASGDLPLGSRPRIEGVTRGTMENRGACVAFHPQPASAMDTGRLEVTIPPDGLLLRTGRGRLEVSVRRFADQFHHLGRVASSSSETLRIRPDRTRRAWHARLQATTPLMVCGLV